MQIHDQMCNLLYCWSEIEVLWNLKESGHLRMGAFQISPGEKQVTYTLEQGFLPFKLSNVFYTRRRVKNPSALFLFM